MEKEYDSIFQSGNTCFVMINLIPDGIEVQMYLRNHS